VWTRVRTIRIILYKGNGCQGRVEVVGAVRRVGGGGKAARERRTPKWFVQNAGVMLDGYGVDQVDARSEVSR
jgi:hypothetical protein